MPHESRTGWHREIDHYGRDIAVGPNGEEMHIFDAERWLLDIAADLEINLARHFRSERPSQERPRPRRGNGATGRQLTYLADLGWRGDEDSLTKEQASELIEKYLARQARSGGRGR